MPLLMDLKCPVEFDKTEVTRDSAGHAQAYIAFRNLSDVYVVGVRAMVTLEDERGQSVDIRPLDYRGIRAPGRSRFSLCLAADRLPYFEDARVLIHEVWLEGEPAYHLEADALMDCSVREEPPGEARTALIGVAGSDAVCYASAGKKTWICLCGRYNENDRPTCIRCGRSRREVFALTPELAMARYAQRRKRENEALEAERIAARQRESRLRRRRLTAYLRRVENERRRTWRIRIGWGAVAIAFVLLIAALMKG